MLRPPFTKEQLDSYEDVVVGDYGALVMQVMQNLPEYSLNFDVDDFDYTACEFLLVDYEEHKRHLIDFNKLVNAAKLMHNKIELGELFSGMTMYEFWDPSYWDAEITDALLQLAIFKDVIYS
jgi:hypothetical protein